MTLDRFPTYQSRLLGHRAIREQLPDCAICGFVAGLRHDRMVAPFVMEGAMNGLKFVEWVRQFLIPTPKRRDVVIMDNLPSHEVPGVREAIESAGATLRYPPQYSPDLSPIENCFSKIKTHLRKAAERTINQLCRRIGKIASSVRAQECCNYLAHAGYGST